MFPENTDDDVLFILKHLGIEDSDHYTQYTFVQNPSVAKKTAAKHPIPTPFTPFDAIKKFIDLRGALVKKTLKNLAPFCKDKSDSERLMQIAEGKSLFQSEITSKQLGLLDIFKMFKSCKPTMAGLIQCS